ncbi:MAG: hypothetical protein MJZ19_11670 [Paludibacteraceae bacterium]|nr:hypothetical protein [Paludibacteraceae bacterium]
MEQGKCGKYDRTELYPLLNEDGDNVMFNMNLSYKDLSMDGFLVATMEKNENGEESVRAVCTAFMGMTLFDFTITDKDFVVNSCMEQLDNKMIVRILRKDLVTLFTKNVQSNFKAKKYSHKDFPGTKSGFKMRTSTGKTKYVVNKEKKMPEHTCVSGGILRAEFNYDDENIVISHPKLGLKLSLTK